MIHKWKNHNDIKRMNPSQEEENDEVVVVVADTTPQPKPLTDDEKWNRVKTGFKELKDTIAEKNIILYNAEPFSIRRVAKKGLSYSA